MSASVLDPVSALVLRGFGMRLGLLTVIAFVPPALLGLPLLSGIDGLAMCCGLGSLINLARALARHEVLATGPLNHWDEALAFAAIARLASLMAATAALPSGS